jgi:hypothetical protein
MQLIKNFKYLVSILDSRLNVHCNINQTFNLNVVSLHTFNVILYTRIFENTQTQHNYSTL